MGEGTPGVRSGIRVSFLVLVLLQSSVALGAVINAPTCQATDVQATIDSAKDGDTVLIPAGTCTWTRTVSVAVPVTRAPKILTLQGAGVDRTIIVHKVDPLDSTKSSSFFTSNALWWNSKDGGVSRLTGITFRGGGLNDPYNKGMVVITGSSHHLRVDDCKFVPNGTHALSFWGYVWGVIDHNRFDLSAAHGYATYIHHHSWNLPGSNYGDASWADGNSFGTERAVFFEDNTVTNNQTVSLQYTAHDGWSGGRVVYRQNTYVNTTIGNHGTESAGRWRGQRQFEIYENTFSLNGPIAWPDFVGSRGGVGVIYSNTAVTTNGASVQRFAAISVFRARTAYAPWGKCDGSSPWDGNDSGGWPCLDQPGRGESDLLSGTSPTPVGWPNQVSDPTYAWNNTVNGKVSGLVPNDPSVLIQNRDFFNSPRPGYESYTYPHPLVSGAAATPPPGPTNLKVQ